MTTLTIGRFSMSDGPSAIRHDGDFLELELQIDAATTSTPAEAKVKRQQLLGMVDNPDESAFPVTFTDDTDLDGFYTVLSVQCEPFEMFLNNGTMLANVSLKRVANGYQNPTVETTVVSQLATNSHSVISTTDHAIGAVWRSAEGLLLDTTNIESVLAASSQAFTTVDGVAIEVRPFADTNVSGTWSIFAKPSTHYDPPSCAIEYKVGSTWYEAVGRQIPNGVAWRINNGLTRVGVTAALPQTNITIEVADSSAWSGREVAGAGNIGGNAGPFIVRNSPELVSVKVATPSGFTVYTVWRGGTIVMMSQTQYIANANYLQVVTADGGTNVTGGIRATSNDASGNRLVFLSRGAVTTTTATPFKMAMSSAATSNVFGLGYNLGATGTGLFSEAGQLGQLCTPPQWRQRIAAR